MHELVPGGIARHYEIVPRRVWRIRYCRKGKPI